MFTTTHKANTRGDLFSILSIIKTNGGKFRNDSQRGYYLDKLNLCGELRDGKEVFVFDSDGIIRHFSGKQLAWRRKQKKTHKKCPSFNCEKNRKPQPLSEFYLDQSNGDGLSIYCKPCMRRRNRINYQKRKKGTAY